MEDFAVVERYWPSGGITVFTVNDVVWRCCPQKNVSKQEVLLVL